MVKDITVKTEFDKFSVYYPSVPGIPYTARFRKVDENNVSMSVIDPKGEIRDVFTTGPDILAKFVNHTFNVNVKFDWSDPEFTDVEVTLEQNDNNHDIHISSEFIGAIELPINNIGEVLHQLVQLEIDGVVYKPEL